MNAIEYMKMVDKLIAESMRKHFQQNREDHDCTMNLKGYCNGCTAIAEALQN